MNTASLARPASTQTNPSLSARMVERCADHEAFRGRAGVQVIQTHTTLLHSTIDAGDCVAIDFDCHQIRYDGLFLISFDHDDGSHWHGARRFQVRPGDHGRELWGQDVGAPGWAQISPSEQWCFRVVGEVREVFKPVSKLRSAGQERLHA